jgi:hypothetical protein
VTEKRHELVLVSRRLGAEKNSLVSSCEPRKYELDVLDEISPRFPSRLLDNHGGKLPDFEAAPTEMIDDPLGCPRHNGSALLQAPLLPPRILDLPEGHKSGHVLHGAHETANRL